ncbi:hypothetical protein [Persephonella sp.]|uniref:hypothetical protein n=1 Tax=Persephonella sp. TaxID=2060922 RepID=UPI0025DFF740|nr:hypothetical protein [Persephonella sp.]
MKIEKEFQKEIEKDKGKSDKDLEIGKSKLRGVLKNKKVSEEDYKKYLEKKYL